MDGGFVTVLRPGLDKIFTVAGSTGGRSRSQPPRRTGGRVGSPPRAWAAPSGADMDRRLAFLQQRQREYDDYNARPRARPPTAGSAAEAGADAAFTQRVEALMGTSDLKERTDSKVQMHEAMMRQKAQARHFDWMRKVYEPVQTQVLAAVDREFERVHFERQRAMKDFLSATAARGGVFLDDLVKNNDYDPYALNASTALRVRVKVVDPLKRVVEKTWDELDLVRRETHRRSRVKETLDPRRWTAMAMESTVTGHLEVKDSQGGVQMAFAGKDSESNVRLDLDFEPPQPRNAVTGRCDLVDAEFPIGKRMAYLYRGQDTSGVVKLQQPGAGVYEPGEPHSDAGGARLDTTRSNIMLSRLRPAER